MNNKALFGLIFLCLGLQIYIFPMRMPEMGKSSAKKLLGLQQREEAISKKRELLIFLDDSEKEKLPGFTGVFLAAAVGGTAAGQKVSPIIVSTSLLNTMMNGETGYYFYPEQWIIKKINNSLNILIPIIYAKDLNLAVDKIKMFDSTMAIDTVSDVELQLGLKVNHMETIEATNWLTYLKTQFLSYFYKSPQQPGLADYFINSLENIFCKRFDYQDRNINIVEWIMFMAGHGALLHSVVDISLDDFKKLLHFLDNKINTKLLVIASCYAGGININQVYGEMKLGTQQYYSFPIIIQALNNTVVTNYPPKVGIKGLFYKKIDIFSPINFSNFFKKAKELEGNYGEIIKPVTFGFVIENTPQIKLPGMEWFSIIDIDKKIVSLDSMLVKARDPHKPLDVVSFFKKDPEIILLYTDNIPFELVVNSLKMKYMISMALPQLSLEEKMIEEIYTRIKKISSTQSFSDILYWFTPIIYSGYSINKFFIDEINDKKNIVIYRTDDRGMRIYYTDKDDSAFTRKLTKQELESEAKEIIFEKLDKDSEFDKYYQGWRDTFLKVFEERAGGAQESSEQMKNIEESLTKKLERQKKIKEAYTVSEPSVD